MREILFRGKTKNRKENEWIEGSLVRCISKFNNEPTVFIYALDTKVDGRGWIGNYYGEEVDPETVGQFTGLVDKNGTKIFEGDVLDVPRWVVTYLADTADAYGMNAGWYIQRDDFESWEELVCREYHVVLGNMYVNPELLQK